MRAFIQYFGLTLLSVVSQFCSAQTNFSVSSQQGCVPLTVNFKDLSTGAVQWNWDFGNGNTSTLQNPSAIYYASGTFSITLTTWDNAGTKTSLTRNNYIRVFKNPKADFSSNPNPVCAGDAVTFSSNSTPGDTSIVKYSWDFGNGILSNKATPTFAYNTAGLYSISLVVTDGFGCQDKILKNTYQLVKPTPKALFTVDSGFNCTVPTSFWFQNKSTGGSLSYSWIFGDGGTSTQKSPSHTYNNLGSYSPSLTVTDTNGCKNTFTISGGINLGSMLADFTATPVKICGTGNVQFNLTGAQQPSTSYDWDFGDGTSANKSAPAHVYLKPGVYTVKLTAKSSYRACSAVVEKKQYIKVDPKPKGSITLSDSFPCKPPFNLSLTYTDTMPLQSIVWTYERNGSVYGAGTGKTINQLVPDDIPRTYKAFVTTKAGCSDSIKLAWVVQSDNLNARFKGDTLGCAALWAQLTDISKSLYPIKSWRWVFHDKSEAFIANPKYLYFDSGKFPVKLYIKTSKNCEDSITQYVHVGYKTTPTFYLGKLQYICNNSDEVSFFNSTQYPGFNIDSFRWVYDDQDKSTKKIPLSQKSYRSTNVKHRYDRDTGMITPMLIGYHNGCADTFKVPDSLFMNPPFAKAEINNNPCLNDSISVKNTSNGDDTLHWVVQLTDEFHTGVYDTFQFHTDSFKIHAGNFYNIILWVKNFKSGCIDTLRLEYNPPSSLTFCGIDQSAYCAPATVGQCVNELPSGLYYWTLDDKDTIKMVQRITYNLSKPGTYKLAFIQDFGSGCVKKLEWPVTVSNGILSGSVTNPKSCIPATIQLIDSGWAPGPAQHAWRLSNGDVVLATAKVMDYTINSVFSDTLIVTLTNEPDAGLCRPFKVFYIPVSGPGVKLNWAWNSLSCTDIRFVANATMNPNKGVKPFSFNWNMGDGKTYNSQFVSHKFSDTGWFDVSVSVTDANGCKVTETAKIYVPENRLVVKITADSLGAACPPLYVNFKDLSTSGNVPIKSWLWNFGDGVTSTLKNPQHQYLIPGKFPVTLTVVDEQGCTRTVKFPDFITISGPYGKYSFDNTEGCYPLKVNFLDSVSKNTTVAEWDFGDGVVVNAFDPSHVYKKPGRYIPALVLKDALGCKYPVPPVDTIYIYDYPIADFTPQGKCLRDSVNLKSTAVTRDEPLKEWLWEFDGNSKKDLTDFNAKLKHKNTVVRHIVATTKGCRDTMEKSIALKNPDISITTSGDTLCLGAVWAGYAKQNTDTLLLSKEWRLNGNFYDTADNVFFKPVKSGQYRFTRFVVDAAGCWDSVSNPWPLKVGDTVIPPITPILRVSVEDDISHHIKYTQFNSFDFSGYTIYRDISGVWTPVASSKLPKDTFKYLGGVDALRRSYCYKVATQNLCGYTQKLSDLISHCTVEVGGKPAINASILKWNAYSGWPVQRYVIYRENTKNKPQLDSIGMVDGNTLTFIDTSIECYVKHVYRILAHEAGGNREWSWSDTCHVTPIYINVVPPPGVRRATVVDDRFVRLEWDELKPNRQALDFFELEKRNPGAGWKWVLTSPYADSFVYHDYKTYVDDASYTYRIRSVDVCGDTSIFSNVGKSILLQTSVNDKYQPVLNWTAYKDWSLGVSHYVIEKRNGDGKFQEIGQTKTGSDTTFIDDLGNLNCIPLFEYRVYAVRNPSTSPSTDAKVISYSNVDAPPVETKIYIPNAFTPDGNVLNDGFRPEGIYIASYEMKIFTRWGEKVYEGTTCMNAWNGTYNGEPAQEGVYVYIVTAKGSDGNLYHFKGDVTLLR